MICSSFTEKDAFIGYQNDTPASVVFQATEQLTEECGHVPNEEESEEWKTTVLQRSQYLLVQMASPDSLVRLQLTSLADQLDQLNNIYSEQCHSSIQDFLSHHLQDKRRAQDGGLLLQVN